MRKASCYPRNGPGTGDIENMHAPNPDAIAIVGDGLLYVHMDPEDPASRRRTRPARPAHGVEPRRPRAEVPRGPWPLRRYGGRAARGELAFWGEWEPPSEVVQGRSARAGLPTVVHRRHGRRCRSTASVRTPTRGCRWSLPIQQLPSADYDLRSCPHMN